MLPKGFRESVREGLSLFTFGKTFVRRCHGNVIPSCNNETGFSLRKRLKEGVPKPLKSDAATHYVKLD